AHLIRVCNDSLGQYFPAQFGIHVEVSLARGPPFSSLPLDSIYVDRALLAEDAGNHAVERVGHIGDQHGVHIPAQHVYHAGQGMRERAQVLSLNARQVDEPHPLVESGPLIEQGLPAVDHDLMASLRQPGSDLNKERFGAAIGGWNSTSAKNGEAQLASVDWMDSCLFRHFIVNAQ